MLSPLLLVSGATMSAPKITLYTHTACPFAQRVWIALEASGLDFEKVDVNLYGSGGFDKSKLKDVEKGGGLSPKGYIPVMAIGDEVIRESSVCVERVAALSSSLQGAQSLTPERPALADELVAACNALPKSSSSRQLDDLLKRADSALSEHSFLAGEQFSVADACLLPFIRGVGGIAFRHQSSERLLRPLHEAAGLREDGGLLVVVVVVGLLLDAHTAISSGGWSREPERA